MNSADDFPLVLLAMHGVALGIGIVFMSWIFALRRRAHWLEQSAPPSAAPPALALFAPQRPTVWLAVRAATPEAVQSALGLGRCAPCSWSEGMSGNHEFFISPQVHGWVIVTGLGLPNPSDDVDAVFLFLVALSRTLGHVEFFYADRLANHHGWARVDEGCVTRAYAWAGETVWNQGGLTLSEIELGLKCSSYGDDFAALGEAEANFEKVPMLAARWSLDPAEVRNFSARQATGIAGGPAGVY
jgi:hypothetical protein